MHDSYQDWKIWKNGNAFSSQGKVSEFCQDWKSQGILLKILEKYNGKVREICQSEIVKTLKYGTTL